MKCGVHNQRVARSVADGPLQSYMSDPHKGMPSITHPKWLRTIPWTLKQPHPCCSRATSQLVTIKNSNEVSLSQMNQGSTRSDGWVKVIGIFNQTAPSTARWRLHIFCTVFQLAINNFFFKGHRCTGTCDVKDLCITLFH